MTLRIQKSLILCVADDTALATTVDKYLGITTHKTKAVQVDLTTGRGKTILAKQLELYNLSLKDNLYKYVINSNFKNKINDVKIEANQFISEGKIVKTLCGQTAPIRPQDIQKGVNDFSIIMSSKSKKELIFLGPAAFINHSCSPNTKWVPNGEALVCVQTIKPISKGEEITTDYGEHFFGENNVDCECECCKKNEENISEVVKETETIEMAIQEDTASTSKESHGVTDTAAKEKMYNTKKLMKAHVSEVHMKIKKFKCSYCAEAFGSSIILFRHKKKEHTEQ